MCVYVCSYVSQFRDQRTMFDLGGQKKGKERERERKKKISPVLTRLCRRVLVKWRVHDTTLSMCLCWNLCPLHLLACGVIVVSVGDWGVCCCVPRCTCDVCRGLFIPLVSWCYSVALGLSLFRITTRPTSVASIARPYSVSDYITRPASVASIARPQSVSDYN